MFVEQVSVSGNLRIQKAHRKIESIYNGIHGTREKYNIVVIDGVPGKTETYLNRIFPGALLLRLSRFYCIRPPSGLLFWPPLFLNSNFIYIFLLQML